METSEAHFTRHRECEFCTSDDDKIQVTVTPRLFRLPPSNEKKRKMEIKNRNPYPIYFKADTSNMDAFRPQPNAGRIPPNSKVCVEVQFFDSVTPIRLHEEVLVVTSLRPFEQYALYDNTICPYCCESLHMSKNHSSQKYPCSSDLYDIRDDYHCYNEGGGLKYANAESKDWQTSKEQETVRRCSLPPRRDTVYADYIQKPQSFSLETPHTNVKDMDAQTEPQAKDHHVRKSIHADGISGLEEICLHAFVHRPTGGNCECNSCFQLIMGGKNEMKARETHQVEVKRERRMSDSTLHPLRQLYSGRHTTKEKEEVQLAKDILKFTGKNGSPDDLMEKVKEAHILARIIQSGGENSVATSDTEISELSSKEGRLQRRRTKFISEEEFKKKLAKAKSKNQKQTEAESKSTSATDEIPGKKEPKKGTVKSGAKTPPTKSARKWAVMSIESKCDIIMCLNWTNFVLLLFLLIITAAFAVCFVTSFKESRMYYDPCFLNLFWKPAA